MNDEQNGPTLSRGYNLLLAKWRAMGEPCTPECEECGADLTGKPVFDRGAWLCRECADYREDNLSFGVHDREDFCRGT